MPGAPATATGPRTWGSISRSGISYVELPKCFADNCRVCGDDFGWRYNEREWNRTLDEEPTMAKKQTGKKRNEKTSARAASAAGRVLQKKRSSKDDRTAAASALTQRPDKKKSRKKK